MWCFLESKIFQPIAGYWSMCCSTSEMPSCCWISEHWGWNFGTFSCCSLCRRCVYYFHRTLSLYRRRLCCERLGFECLSKWPCLILWIYLPSMTNLTSILLFWLAFSKFLFMHVYYRQTRSRKIHFTFVATDGSFHCPASILRERCAVVNTLSSIWRNQAPLAYASGGFCTMQVQSRLTSQCSIFLDCEGACSV